MIKCAVHHENKSVINLPETDPMAVKIPNMSIPPGQVSLMGVTQTIPQPFVTDYSSAFVTCGLSLLMVMVSAPRVFLRFFRFSSLCKNQHSK